MRFNLILFTIVILFINYTNGFLISKSLSDKIKSKLSNIINSEDISESDFPSDSITGIISAPDFGISHLKTTIVDDDNKVSDDMSSPTPNINFNFFAKPRPIGKPGPKDKPAPIAKQSLLAKPSPKDKPHPLKFTPKSKEQALYLDSKPKPKPSPRFWQSLLIHPKPSVPVSESILSDPKLVGIISDIGTDEFILTDTNFINKENIDTKPMSTPDALTLSIGDIENFPIHKPRFGNLRGNQVHRLEERSLLKNSYIEDEDIIDYIELGFETNIQSECDTANYLRKAGFPESSIGTMVCIAKYESGFNCDATNVNTDGSTDYGEFQINSYWWCSGDPKSKYNGCATACSSLFNCQSNANCAYAVWKQQGYNAWYAYKNHKSTCDNYPKPC